MIKLSHAKKLAKNYKRITDKQGIIKKALCGESFYIRKLEMMNLKTDVRSLRKLDRYINLYKTIFLKSLDSLEGEAKDTVFEIYVKGRSAVSFSVENFIGKSSIYRCLKEFDTVFFNSMSMVSRAGLALLPLCHNRKRRCKLGEIKIYERMA